MQIKHAAAIALAAVLGGLVVAAVIGATYFADISRLIAPADAIENFSRWPLETKVRRSSVILRTEWKPQDGFYRAVIAEIIKPHQNQSALPFTLGDEYGNERYPIREGTDYGDGEIQFFTGSPPEWQYSSVTRGAKLSGLADAPLDRIRMLAREEHAH